VVGRDSAGARCDVAIPPFAIPTRAVSGFNVTYRINAQNRPTSTSALPLEPSVIEALSSYAAYINPAINAQYVVTRTESVWVVSVDCGPFGRRLVTCGPGWHNRTITYTCPTVATLPTCGYWDTAARQWTDRGCTAVSAGAGTILCRCQHFTHFSARFSRVAVANQAVFSTSNTIDTVSQFTWAPHAVVMLACVAGLLLCCVSIASFQDGLAGKKMLLT